MSLKKKINIKLVYIQTQLIKKKKENSLSHLKTYEQNIVINRRLKLFYSSINVLVSGHVGKTVFLFFNQTR